MKDKFTIFTLWITIIVEAQHAWLAIFAAIMAAWFAIYILKKLDD